ncbi:MAG: YceI family protein [Lentimicrobium sp.]|nr:YceI family protein [Lentimicrobium sp.]
MTLFCTSVTMSQTITESVLYSTATGNIKIKSEAPLELIEASSNELKGVIDISKKTFSFAVQNRSIKGFNSPLQQEHFHENYIETTKYPATTFKGKIIEQVDFSMDGKYEVRAKGILNIHGVDQERIIKANIEIKNKLILLNSSFTVPLSDHNITIPKIVYQKIAEEVNINVNASLTGVKK